MKSGHIESADVPLNHYALRSAFWGHISHRVQLKGTSLLWRILLSTSIAAAALFAATGWMVEGYARRVSERGLEEEVRTSLQAYQALWAARTKSLASISRVISSMSDVRAAFMTRDKATIRDTASQLWSQVSDQDALFLVLDPQANVIASLGGSYPDLAISSSYLRSARKRFPNQVAGYLSRQSHLYYIVLTPVYVQAERDPGLLYILLVALDIKDQLAADLKASTHGSDFLFTVDGRQVASTVPLAGDHQLQSRRWVGGNNYLVLNTDLTDIDNHPIGRLSIMRSFAGPRHVLGELERNIALTWLLAIVIGLALTYLLARRILKPIRRLDHAAGEIIKGNYECRIPVETADELGRLAETFNAMCDSIRSAREQLIHQERIATIGRLSTSIVHDLRNPLAAIYGGAEMLVDSDLSAAQSRRLALTIYKASDRIRKLLQDLTDVARSRPRGIENCKLIDIVRAAYEAISRGGEVQHVSLELSITSDLEIAVERERVERVFMNLINNAFEAMQDFGTLTVVAHKEERSVIVRISDSGPGIAPHAWPTLFQPFASFGKKTGVGLGLALSRQTILEHGGDLWAEPKSTRGALFLLRLPLAEPSNSD